MNELTRTVPNTDVLLALEPEELGAKLLSLLSKRRFQMGIFSPSNLTSEIWALGAPEIYPRQRRNEIEAALAEAWAWLESQGLIVAAPGTNGSNGFKFLSRRDSGREFFLQSHVLRI
jgi:hypothetical protein